MLHFYEFGSNKIYITLDGLDFGRIDIDKINDEYTYTIKGIDIFYNKIYTSINQLKSELNSYVFEYTLDSYHPPSMAIGDPLCP